MARTNPTFRVFVSSTFEDFDAERNALQASVFPELRERCEARGARFQAIDLRWGVSHEASRDQLAMGLCLQEIARCRASSPRPNFIALLGNRYGWRPLPSEIRDDEFARILAHVGRPPDRRLIAEWYRRDDNAVPPAWILRPRPEREGEPDDWPVVERRLRRVLVRAAELSGLDAAHMYPYWASAAHQEITAGVLEPKDAPSHVSAFLRSIGNLAADARPSGFVDLDAGGRRDRKAQHALAGLRAAVTDRLPERNVFRYPARWTGDGVTTEHLDAFCRDVEASLWSVIESALDAFGEREPLDVEIAAHRAFADERRRQFVGRTAARDEIAAYVAGAERRPLIVHGVGGSGKSSLMARAAADASEAKPRALVVSRFVGATAASTASGQLLRGICDEVGRAYGSEVRVHDDYPTLVSRFRALLARASPDRPVILFVDALDQLGASGPDALLDWLPPELPADARVVLSTLSPDPTSGRRPARVLELGPMAEDEGAELLERWLQAVGRTLTENQRRAVLARFAGCSLPLYLRLAFEQARWWRSDESAPELAAETTGLIEDLLTRLGDEANHGEVLVARSMGYLAAARNGLTEDELVDVLSLDADVMRDFSRRSPESPATDRLPPIVWSRLYADLDPYLSQRSADGTATLAFYHRQLAEVVALEFLSGRSRLARTRHLAGFFDAQPSETLRDAHRAPNVRKLSELPFLLTRAAAWSRLERTLCDLDFVRAKCAAGLTYDLVEDYAAAERALPESRREWRAADERARRMVAYAGELEACARRRGEDVPVPEPPPAVRPWSPDELSRRIRQSVKGTSRADRVGAFARFVNSESHRIASFVGHPAYLVQQAHNSGNVGPVATAAEDSVNGSGLTAPALLARPSARREPDPYPPILRTFDSSIDAEGGVVAMTPDGRRAVSNSAHGFRVWEVATGRLIAAVDADQGRVGAVAITARGELAVTGNGDNTVRVWDTDTGQCLTVLSGHTDRPAVVCVTPDGGLVASGGSYDDPSVRVWDPAAETCVHTFLGHEGPVTAIAVTANGSRLVTGGDDTTVRVWDLATGCVKVLSAHAEPLRSVAMTPDGRRMVSCGDEEQVILWDLERGRRLHTLARRGFSAVAITADGQLVIGASRSGLQVWDAETGDGLRSLEPPSGAVAAIEHVASTADGSLALTGSYDGILNLWDVTRGHHELTGAELFTGSVSSVSFTAAGDAIVTGGDGELFLNSRTGRGRKTVSVLAGGSGRHWNAAAISADGARVLATGADGTIAIYKSHRRLPELKASDGHLEALETGPDGRQLLSGGEDKTLRLWDLETRRQLHEFTGHPGGVIVAAIAPDGVLAVSASYSDVDTPSKTLIFWNLETGKRIRLVKRKGSPVYCLAIAPDGRRVVSGGLDLTLQVWDTRSGDCVQVLDGHTAEVVGVAITADGRRVISGSRDQTVRVWNVDTGSCVAVAGLRFVVTSLGLGGRDLIVGGQGGNMPEFELRDPDEGTGRATLGYRYDNGRRAWDAKPRADCPWCGSRFAPPARVATAITSIARDLKPGHSPCVRLPDAAFDEPALVSACSRCKAPLVFNPFVLDTRAAWA